MKRLDGIEAILTRQSIRRFADEPVSDEDIETIIASALSAPSAFNQRCVRIVLVRDPLVLEQLTLTHSHATPLRAAKVGLVVCGDTRVERYPGSYWDQDATAALENALIAANALGLGAVWIGVKPWPDRMKHVRETVRLPHGVEPLGLVAIGQAAERHDPTIRFDASWVHQDRWGEQAVNGDEGIER